MLSAFLQFLFSGLTVGAMYALAALGYGLIYNASGVINFAQGEFIMLGGMAAVFLTEAGVPLPVAIVLAVAIAALVGLVVEKLAIEPAGNAEVVTLARSGHSLTTDQPEAFAAAIRAWLTPAA